MKLLLSAYACEPGKGSEPGVGWNMVRGIARHHQVWVLTSRTHQPGIESELARNPVPNLKFVYFDPMQWTYDWSNEGQKVHWSIHLHYYLWQIWAYLVAKPLHQDVNFDLIHHVTYVKYSGPSFLSLLPVPFVWGPVGGGESAPKAFWKDFNLRGKTYETLRNWARHFGEQDPFVRLTVRRSKITYATTEDTAQRLRKMGASNVHVFSEAGLPETEISRLAELSNTKRTTIRFISMARLLHWKGFHLGLRAFAEANLPDAEYWVFGDGPERQRLEALAAELGITQQVKFWNRLPRDELLLRLAECVALVHPSLHDSGGWVCLEAMAAGCPVICLDLGGPAIQVTEQTGFKIAADTPEQAVHDLATAMVCLATDPELRLQMGQAGQQRVKDYYSWETKAQLFGQIYEKVAMNEAIAIQGG